MVFTQSGCSPCQKIVPELNRLADGGTQVVVVNNGDPEATRTWSAEVGARDSRYSPRTISRVSRRYEVFATPFAFLIDETGAIASKGIIHSRQHLRYVLAGTGVGASGRHPEPEADAAESSESDESSPTSTSREVHHV